MKRLIYSAFVLITLTFVLSSCDEDKYLEWKYLNETWLEQHKSDSGFVQTESGLCYKVIHQGATRRPNSSRLISFFRFSKIFVFLFSISYQFAGASGSI